MGGLFGVVSDENGVKALFYGTDDHSQTLKYVPIDKRIAAVGLPGDVVCLYCWRGR
jgi:hypothetical protein